MESAQAIRLKARRHRLIVTNLFVLSTYKSCMKTLSPVVDISACLRGNPMDFPSTLDCPACAGNVKIGSTPKNIVRIFHQVVGSDSTFHASGRSTLSGRRARPCHRFVRWPHLEARMHDPGGVAAQRTESTAASRA